MKRILVLDDDKNILEVLEETLRYSNYEVKLIEESKNLFSIINEFDPHLILLDFLLLDENGGEICYKLKNKIRDYTRKMTDTIGVDSTQPHNIGGVILLGIGLFFLANNFGFCIFQS